MGRLPSRIGASPATGSTRRSSHVHSSCTPLRAFMDGFRPVSASALPAATSAHPPHGRGSAGLRGRQAVRRFAAPVCRRPRGVSEGRRSAPQPRAGRRGACDPPSPARRLGGGAGRAKPGAHGQGHQARRLAGRATPDHAPAGAGRCASRPSRPEHTHTPRPARLVFSGVSAAPGPVGGHRRAASGPAGQAGAPPHAPPRCRAAPGLPQHTPPGAPDFGSPPSALAPRLDGVCPVRPWGRLGTMEPLGPSPQRAGARPPPGPSPAPGGAPRPAGCRAQAPALDARAPHRDGWDQHDLLRASDYRASPRCAPRGPCRGGHTAPPGAIRGVLAADGAHALGPPGLAG